METCLINGLYRVCTPYLCAGFIVENGKVTHCAPILKNKINYWITVAKYISNMRTPEEAKQIMADRGYGFTARNGRNDTLFFTKVVEGIIISAVVDLSYDRIELSNVELKMLVILKTNLFAFDHERFGDFEATLIHYTVACMQADTHQDTNKKSGQVVIGERKAKFWDKIREAGKGKYSKDLCADFYRHWSEMNEGGKKMRWEMEKVFDIKKRLITWKNNDIKFDKRYQDKTEKKAAEQTAEIKPKAVVDKKQLF